jgi:hypothetical protein
MNIFKRDYITLLRYILDSILFLIRTALLTNPRKVLIYWSRGIQHRIFVGKNFHP